MMLQSVTDLKYKPSRIVSLVPSQTELLHFLGLEEEMAAITKFCVHPPEWRRTKKIIGGTKNIHVSRIINLHPGLIIANKEENVKEQVEELAKSCPVWLTDVADLAGALRMIQDIGELTHSNRKAKKLVANIEARFFTITINRMAIPTAYLIWQKPYLTIGGDTFINDMLRQCGLKNIFAHKTRYPAITLADIREAGCRLLLLSSEPYPFAQQQVEELKALLPGIKILLADGEMFSWYGSRLLQAPGYFNRLMAEINS